MKRKIVKHGANTLTISLPSRWAKDQQLKAGCELEILERDSSLLVRNSTEPKTKDIIIDLSVTDHMLPRIIAGIYKAGFDRVHIHYSSSEELELIQDTIYRYCHEYEIIHILKNMVEIKSISSLNPKDFEQMFRKVAQATINIARETFEAVRKQEYDELSNLILKDKLVDRYASFGSRVINKGFDIDNPLTGPLYLILDETEIAADIFKVISRETVNGKIRLNDRMLHFFEHVIELMELQYDLLFDFNMEKLKQLGSMENEIRKEIDTLCSSEKKDIKILAYLINLFETVFQMKSAIISLNIGTEQEGICPKIAKDL